MRIKPGYGYWATDSYPIGGSFHRAGPEGLPILSVLRSIEPPCKGCTMEVLTPRGKVATCKDHCEGEL